MASSYRSEEQVLEKRLRGEALASRPEFSQALHDRLCAAVCDSAVRRVSVVQSAGRGRWLVRGVAMAAAVAAVLLTSIVVWRGQADREDQRLAVLPENSSGSIEETLVSWRGMAAFADSAVEGLDGFVDSEVDMDGWANLDDDACLAMKTLADDLPFDVPSHVTLALCEATGLVLDVGDE
jgi:hypothetical protein